MKKVYIFKVAGAPDLLLYKKNAHYQLALRASDGTVNKGQWLLHVKIFLRNCSYNGKYFGYQYITLHPKQPAGRSYSVISTPPFFTAHIIWNEIGTWTEGPRLEGNIVHLHYTTPKRHLRGILPEDLTINATHLDKLPGDISVFELEHHNSDEDGFVNVAAPYDSLIA